MKTPFNILNNSPFSNFRLAVLECVCAHCMLAGVNVWLHRLQRQTGFLGQVANRQTGVGVAVRDWLTAGGGCALGAPPDPPHRRSFSDPSISPPGGTRTVTGLLAAMSSILGVVRKQLKSHPAVSDRAGRFRPSGAVTLRARRRTRVRRYSHQTHPMCHHLMAAY